MRLGEIELPWEIIDSIEEESLVIFVGAGASVDPPSNLPLFPKLTERIAEGSLTKETNEPLDRFLGRVEQAGRIHVHRRAAQLLSEPESAPNELHRLLIELFREPGKIRVVTTNFDLHLESAIRASFLDASTECEIFRAPALPATGDFRGLVYVHGCPHPDPSRMVLTDRDFGRAYLTQGWARRFLTELFATNNILFVGYSHSDLILNYLARGLPAGSARKRAALTEAGDSNRWQFLGIEPLEYSTDDHDQVRVVLEEWGRLRSLTALDHENELRQILARPIELLTPTESDRLLWTLRGTKHRHLFFNQATSAEWLDWGNSKALIAPIFDASSTDLEVSNWFAEDPLSERGDVAIAILQRHSRRRLAYASWCTLAHRISASVENTERELEAEERRRLTQWLSILRLHDGPGWDWQMQEYLFGSLGVDSAGVILELLDALTEPQLIPTDRYRLFQEEPTRWSSELQYRMPRNIHGVCKGWERIALPNMEKFAVPLLRIVQHQLERGHRLLGGVGQASARFDPQSYHRRTIVESDQTRHPDGAIDFLVVAARDSLEWMVANEPKKGRALIELWLESDPVLLQRLALHGAAAHAHRSLSAIQKARYLLAKDRINNLQLHSEVFGLLTILYPELSTAWRKRLLNAKQRLLRRAYRDEEREDADQGAARRAYNWFQFLSWLKRADPECEFVVGELERLRSHYPDFEEDERPELTHYVGEAEYVAPVEPLSSAEMLALEPTEVYHRYCELVESDGPDSRDTIGGYRDVVEKASLEDLSWSLSTGEYLLDAQRTEERRAQDLQRSLIRSWSKSDLGAENWGRVVDLLRKRTPSDAVKWAAVDLIEKRFESKASELDGPSIQKSLGLALMLHASLRTTSEGFVDPTDPLQQAINHPVGKLALFAVRALSRSLKLDLSSAEDLPDLWQLLNSLVDDVEHGKPHGLVVLASQLHFMLYANREWTLERLLPLFLWEKSGGTAASLWAGFFFWGPLSPPVVETILPLLPQLFVHLEELPERVRRRASEYQATIVFRQPESPIGQPWFRDYLRLSSDEDRQSFARQMQQILSELSNEKDNEKAESPDSMWGRVLVAYVDARLESGTIGDREWSAVALWCRFLDRSIPEFVGRLVRGPEPYDQHTSIFHHLADAEHVYQYPDDIARFVAHMLGGQRRGEFWYHDDVRRIVRKLQKAGASSALVAIVKNKTIELGASNSFFEGAA